MSFAAYRILLWRYGDGRRTSTTAPRSSWTRRWRRSVTGPTSRATEGDAPGGARQPHRGSRHRVRREPMDRSRRSATRTPSYMPGQRPARGRQAGRGHERPEPLAAARAWRADLAERPARSRARSRTSSGPHWGHVTGVRAAAEPRTGMPIDPGPPPRLGDPATRRGVQGRGRRHHPPAASELDATDGVTIDISPGALGDNPLGTNDGDGPRGQPATGQPYEPHVVPARRLRAGPGRVLGRRAEVGDAARALERRSPTQVSDSPGFEPRIGGDGRSGRSARVGREDVPRAQRRGPRRGHRRLGREGLLRLGATDLDDPLHGRARASRATRTGRRTTPRACPSCRTWSR